MGVNIRMGTQGRRGSGGHEDEKGPPGNARFQFGLKHLLALPVVVALFFALAYWLGMKCAVFFSLLALCGVGAWFERTRGAAGLVAFVVVAGTCLIGVWFPGPDRSMRAGCNYNLKQICLALHEYNAAYGCLPPAYVEDEKGRPMHSWRVMILPFLGQEALYRKYRFDEPWDGPNNRRLVDAVIEVFSCPAENGSPSTMTNYLAVIGPHTAWPGTRSTRLDDFANGTSNTLLVVEVADSGIHWMEPRDLHVVQMAPTVNSEAGQGISCAHPGGANVAFADGSGRFLPEGVSREELRALLTIAGGEPMDPDNLAR